MKKVSLCAYDVFTKNVCLNLGITKHIIFKDRFYNKKFNLDLDTAKWEGWSIESLALQPNKKRVYFYYLRRKYIPPLLESYSDFSFLTTIDFSKLNDEKIFYFQSNGIPEVEKIIETITDSLFSRFVSYYKDYCSILEVRADSLTLDRSSMKYYLHSLLISGKETYQIGLQFVLKVIEYIIEKINSKDKSLKEIFNLVLNKTIMFLEKDSNQKFTEEYLLN